MFGLDEPRIAFETIWILKFVSSLVGVARSASDINHLKQKKNELVVYPLYDITPVKTWLAFWLQIKGEILDLYEWSWSNFHWAHN
jgi:hypothetical protein